MANQPEESNEPIAPAGALGEISQGPGAFENFLDQHHMKILVFGLLAAIGVAGYVIKEGIDEGRETAGSNALHQAGDLATLQDILKNHEGSRAAGSAAILLAEAQWEEGQQDAAIETLRAFIDSGSGHPAKPTALASLGSKLAIQGKVGDAGEVFRTLADNRTDGTHLAAFALVSLGDLAQQAGNIEEAEAHYTRARTEFSTSPFSDAAVSRLQFLKADLPSAVDPVVEEGTSEEAEPETSLVSPQEPPNEVILNTEEDESIEGDAEEAGEETAE